MRRRVLPPLVAQARNAASSLADVLTDPVRVIGLIGGRPGSRFVHPDADASVAAFGGRGELPRDRRGVPRGRGAGFGGADAGGLGAVEAALVAALSGYGMASGPAVSAVLTFRLVTYWLPMLPGWFMFQQMQRREEL